jgi:hypothetical protein
MAMVLVAVAALNFRAALPGSALIHGAGHWIGAIILEVVLIAALWRRRPSLWLIGFEAVGWAYLVWRALDAGPAVYWWEDILAHGMVRAESRFRGVSWGFDRWYVLEAHIRTIQLAFMMVCACVGGFAVGLVRIAGRRRDVALAYDPETTPAAPV